MKINMRTPQIKTHEGAVAKHINPELQLRRTVMCCMLWEKQFYEDGQSVVDRIKALIPLIDPVKVAEIAIEAREEMKLRHMPLLIVREMARLPKHKALVAQTLARVIQRPDELAEYCAIYWKDGRTPLSAQSKKGLAKAFGKFNEYQLAKYNRDGAVKLRDVLFLCHAKPETDRVELYKKLVDKTLTTPDTWEVELSASKDKTASWNRLLSDGKLGAMGLLRNLRNMQEAGIEDTRLAMALTQAKTDRVLPFRFISAARHAPQLEPALEIAMLKCLEGTKAIAGKTCLLVDVSGSMEGIPVSGKSEIDRLDAACGLAILLRGVIEDLAIVTFSDRAIAIPPRRGFALRDAIKASQIHAGTNLGGAINAIPEMFDRLIVITDEQAEGPVPDPKWKHSYMINVAAYQNGVGYGKWTHIDGWSEAIVDYIKTYEAVKYED